METALIAIIIVIVKVLPYFILRFAGILLFEPQLQGFCRCCCFLGACKIKHYIIIFKL